MRRRDAIGGLVCLSTAGCASTQEVILVTAEGRRVTAQDIDEDPWKLLPPGAVGWMRTDAKALFDASFGDEVAAQIAQKLPFADGAGVDPKADLDVLIGAGYATVGSDIIGLSQGRFDKTKIAAAVEKNPKTAFGLDIQTTTYAGVEMYVASQVAMAVLTEKTLVFGTQLGVRRVLERVEEGRLKRTTPAWFDALLKDGAADFQVGIDLESQPVPAAFRSQLAFLESLRAARLLGNFKPPGINIAGTLTYQRPSHAEKASEALLASKKQLAQFELLFSMLNVPPPLQTLKSQVVGKDAQVAIGIDGDAVAAMMKNADKFLGKDAGGEWLQN